MEGEELWSNSLIQFSDVVPVCIFQPTTRIVHLSLSVQYLITKVS